MKGYYSSSGYMGYVEGRWVLSLEDVPVADDDTAQITELVCRDLETGAYEIWESLY